MPSTRYFRLVVAALTVAMCGAFALSAWHDRKATRAEAGDDLGEIARLMEEHTGAALLAGDLQLSRLQDLMGRRTPAQMAMPADGAALKRLTADLPMWDSVWIFDADARVRASSYDLPPGGMNVGDRAYYTALRDGAANFIGPLIWGRLRKEPFFTVSRRLQDQAGRFLGGIQVSLKASYFIDFYRNLSSVPDTVFAIYRDDGSLVMRSILPPGQETFPKPQLLLNQLARAPSGLYQAVTIYDDMERLWVYRRMAGQPLVVVAGIPVKQIFAGWRERTLRNGVIAAVILAAFLAVASKLSATLQREASLRARAEALLADKEILFQEIHHRVKNNLQIIASFLTMQAVHARDPAISAAFDEALSRLQSMGLVHQILYEQNQASEVSVDSYLCALAASVGQTYGAEGRGIAISIQAADIKLVLDQAVPLALLANEALTNALKHAFPDQRGGHIQMGLSREGDHMVFVLCDDGVGMTADAKRGLGMTILNSLTRQLEGRMAWSTGPGTRLTVTFPA